MLRKFLRVAIAVSACLVALRVGYYLLGVQFSSWDDEGYMLLSLKHYLAGGHLYTQVFTEYGPVFFWIQSSLFHIFHQQVTHDAGRRITLLPPILTRRGGEARGEGINPLTAGRMATPLQSLRVRPAKCSNRSIDRWMWRLRNRVEWTRSRRCGWRVGGALRRRQRRRGRQRSVGDRSAATSELQMAKASGGLTTPATYRPACVPV